MFQGIFKSAINDANKNYIFGTGSIPIQIKVANLETFANSSNKQQGYQVAEVNKLISTMLTGWNSNGNKPKSMSDNYLELTLSCGNGVVVKKRLQFPHIIAWKDDSTPYNIADVYKPFSIDNWLKADDFENPDITLVVEPTDEILTTSTATPPEVTTEQSGRFYLYYRNLPVGVNRVHIDFHIKTKTEPIDFDLEIADGLSWKDAQTILASNAQAKINVLLDSVKDVYKYTGAEGNFENITMHEWSALYQQIISLKPNNKFTHDLYFEGGLVNDVNELNDKFPIKVNCVKAKSDLLGASPISVTIPNTFKKGVIGFTANLDNDFTGRIKIYSAGAYNVGRIELDSTNIYYYNVLNGGTPVRTIAHGLTLGTFVSVLIKTDVISGYRCSVLVSTQSGQFEDDNPNGYWNAASAPISVEMVTGECTNAELSFSIMYKNVLLCGDSYMDYLIRNISICNGKTAPQLIIDGYPGRNSNDGYNSLIATMSMITPKVLIWALGMNDPDNIQSYNASWKENLDKVIALCNKQGVDIVLVTIPSAKDDSGNFGTHNNEKKNDWIRNSGYRYIDIARAVGAKSDGTWAEGLKANDIHPSNAGAKLIWGAYLSSVPEING